MYGLNEVTLLGKVVQEPLPSGEGAERQATLVLGTSRPGPGDGATRDDRVDLHQVVLVGPLADVAMKYFRSGSRIYAQGQLRYSTWLDANGKQRQTAEILIDRNIGKIRLLDNRPGARSGHHVADAPIEDGPNLRAPASDLEPGDVSF